MTDLGFDGKVAIITGAGGGLGRQHALMLAKRGALVVVNDLGGSVDGTGSDKGAAEHVVDEIKAAGGEAVANTDSVATPEGGKAIVQTALDAFGKVDIVINNAGILRDKSFTQHGPRTLFDPVIDVHLKGAFNVSSRRSSMQEQGYGRIVSTSSAAGMFGNFGQTNYGAAKMGLVGLTRVLAVEGAKYNIKANAIAPLALTRMTENIMGGSARQARPGAGLAAGAYLAHEDCHVTRPDLLRRWRTGRRTCSSPRRPATRTPTSPRRTCATTGRPSPTRPGTRCRRTWPTRPACSFPPSSSRNEVVHRCPWHRCTTSHHSISGSFPAESEHGQAGGQVDVLEQRSFNLRRGAEGAPQAVAVAIEVACRLTTFEHRLHRRRGDEERVGARPRARLAAPPSRSWSTDRTGRTVEPNGSRGRAPATTS